MFEIKLSFIINAETKREAEIWLDEHINDILREEGTLNQYADFKRLDKIEGR